jgi:glycosyltransferase involved in cell wall biosynthesis
VARAAGKRIVWTCHNLEPHEDATWPVRASFGMLAGQTDLVICHDDETSERCRNLYSPSGRFVVMPHGNYEGVYPPGRPREEVLGRVGLPGNAPVLLCIGQVRPYKATDLACDAVAELGDGVSLLIAGSTPIPAYSQRVKKLVAALPNAVFIAREVTDQEFADFVRASDVVLLPYRSVTGSGAALAALTLGRGVVASSMPFFANLLRGHPEAGRVIDSGDPRALAQAIRAFLEVPADERERAARRLAARFAWADVVAPVAESLRRLVS